MTNIYIYNIYFVCPCNGLVTDLPVAASTDPCFIQLLGFDSLSIFMAFVCPVSNGLPLRAVLRPLGGTVVVFILQVGALGPRQRSCQLSCDPPESIGYQVPTTPVTRTFGTLLVHHPKRS